jgi:putative heme iron utilization protein
MEHESRLTVQLRLLLNSQRIAALGTIAEDGWPFVSMVPFAIEAGQGFLVIHVSGLAPHTRSLRKTPHVSLMVMQAEVKDEPVHALHRVSLQGLARVLAAGEEQWSMARTAYLKRFPDAREITELGDFCFVAIDVQQGRQVAGFGAARTVDHATLALVLKHAN